MAGWNITFCPSNNFLLFIVMVYFLIVWKAWDCYPWQPKWLRFYLWIRQASLQRAVLIQLMLGLGTPQRIKASFVVFSVLHAISETSVASQLWLLHLLSPSELKSIALAAVIHKNFGIMESSLRTFYFLIIIFFLQSNQDKLEKTCEYCIPCFNSTVNMYFQNHKYDSSTMKSEN